MRRIRFQQACSLRFLGDLPSIPEHPAHLPLQSAERNGHQILESLATADGFQSLVTDMPDKRLRFAVLASAMNEEKGRQFMLEVQAKALETLKATE
ncbi:hypothetical protein IAT38_003850 [Cryptococcus sp. DSM 104549]